MIIGFYWGLLIGGLIAYLLLASERGRALVAAVIEWWRR